MWAFFLLACTGDEPGMIPEVTPPPPAVAFAEPPTGIEAFYASLGVAVSATVVDGDCGLDVMCLMSGWTRCNPNRHALRYEPAAVALKHSGNRAVVAMLRHVGELNAHL